MREWSLMNVGSIESRHPLTEAQELERLLIAPALKRLIE
jgi:hypothetical protein